MEALPDAIDIVILFLIIMVALFTGMVTATEAARQAAPWSDYLYREKKLT